jgi:predicted DNA-binding mobile mystery protein A
VRTREQARRSRQRLDERFRGLGAAERYAPPRAGWIRAIRESLGMSLADLGGRLGVTASTVLSMEKSEQAGTIRLSTLRRAAAALDCTVAYVLIPNASLHETVLAQAERVVDAEANAAGQSMALEAQAADLPPAARQAMVDRMVASGRLWSRR